MPAKPAWLLHIPEIISQLEVFEVPVIDRAIVERLFGLRRRQAIELMHRFDGYKSGQTFLVERRHIIEELRRQAEGEDCQSEVRRRQWLEESVDRLRRGRAAVRVKIPVTPDVWKLKMAALRDGVLLKVGRLQVDFNGAEDLLRKLFALAQAATNDFDRFHATVEPVEGGPRQDANASVSGEAASPANRTA